MRNVRTRLIALLSAVFAAALVVMIAPPASAFSAKSEARPGWAIGSVTVNHYTQKSLTYNAYSRDLNCNVGGSAWVKIRVWYTDGSSQYGSVSVTDPNPCDAYAQGQTGLSFGGNGKTIAYFRVVLYDTQHQSGVLGNVQYIPSSPSSA